MVHCPHYTRITQINHGQIHVFDKIHTKALTQTKNKNKVIRWIE